ncbi:Mitochondrial uncoupling protein 3 [Diplonema papillatum]|nr:Mitochondrial uncoupling protein 3 [Diplonema papillatum]
MGSTDLTVRFLCSSSAACIAEVCTYPMDTMRVRLQLLAGTGSGAWKVAADVARQQGLATFYRGIPPALARQFVQCGINLGAYMPIRSALGADKDHSVWKKGAAGAVSGSVGQFCAIPADVVKVRLQADAKSAQLGEKPLYTGTVHAFVDTYRERGVVGMWRGATPSCCRSAAIHSCGLASYDTLKHSLVDTFHLNPDATATHVIASGLSGVVASAAGCPFDVIKTRVMASPAGGARLKPSLVTREVFRQDGLRGFFKGFVPTLARLGPWQIVWLTCYEQLSVLMSGHSKF